MNRFYGKIPLLILLLVAGGLIYYSPSIRNLFLTFSTSVQKIYLSILDGVDNAIQTHLDQADQIKKLHHTVKSLEKKIIRLRAQAAECEEMVKALSLKPDVNATFYPARAAGYALLGNFQQLWLKDFSAFDGTRNYGVVHNGFAIGIVVDEKGRPLMILAGDKSCNFAVSIGKEKAPGIAKGEDAKHMVVHYIPEWMKIKRGDSVFTSGLDQIFPPGLPVGRVLSVKKMQGFKNARIELFGDTLHPSFVWIVSP